MKPLLHLGLLALLLLAACHADRYTIGSTIASDQRGNILVLGDHPRVEVENIGPGRLVIRFEGSDGASIARTLEPGAATMQTLRGPVRIRLDAKDGGACSIELVADGSDGVEANVTMEFAE
jgi:hypothetical protein